ncbi:hypothetical protein KCP71_03645 [Salmonella enterica subsp. enterica]|nr:hypothetical protein KCP71_03645 [Salmonella enterica subsp. enterica]
MDKRRERSVSSALSCCAVEPCALLTVMSSYCWRRHRHCCCDGNRARRTAVKSRCL